MKKNKILSILTALVATFLLGGVVYGGSPSTATNIIPIVVTNTQTSVVSDETVSVPLAMKSLVDGGFIASDGLNFDLHISTTDTPFMSGTDRLDVKYAFNNGGTNKTTQATNATIDDVDLPAANAEVFEFALDHPSRILHLNISQAVAASSYVISWEYYNGSSWVAFTAGTTVTDNTNSFSALGSKTVELGKIPSDWNLSTLHAVSGHWLRAVATASGITTAPLAAQAWYETGRSFFSVDEIDPTLLGNYDLYLGGSDMSTNHYYFPGFAGLTSRFNLNKPIIAAVNGVSMGGGFEIALACDLIIASDNARFALPEPKVGLAALAGGMQRLPRQIGMKNAMGMMLTGRHVGAEEAKDCLLYTSPSPRD